MGGCHNKGSILGSPYSGELPQKSVRLKKISDRPAVCTSNVSPQSPTSSTKAFLESAVSLKTPNSDDDSTL